MAKTLSESSITTRSAREKLVAGARSLTFPSEQTASTRSLTRSQARSLLSIAKLKRARSRSEPTISSRTRIDQTCLGRSGPFLADQQPFVPGS